MKRLLYVEDDGALAFLTKDQLSEAGFEVIHFLDGSEAWKSFVIGHFDLCLLDIMVPGKDGFDLVKSIRSQDHEIPIIFLSAKSLLEDRISGLKIGADDYLTKPYAIDELLLKINVFINRPKKGHLSQPPWEIGSLTFDATNLVINKGGKLITSLTEKEALLLKMLLMARNHLVKREDILMEIWGENDYFKGRSLDVFITRLRKYLACDSRLAIKNVHGVGFRLTDK